MSDHLNTEAIELGADEFRALVEQRVQDSLGLTLDEFVQGLNAGTIDPEAPGVAGLAILVAPRAAA